MQNARSALQKYLKGRLSNVGTTYTRFCYAAPFAILYMVSLASIGDLPIPEPNLRFWIFTCTGAVAQIMATVMLIYLFSQHNFIVGIAYSKTESIQAAIFSSIILNETLKATAIFGILISLIGVIALSIDKKRLQIITLFVSWINKTTWIGILSGALFGLSAVTFRGASLALGGDGFLMQAAFTLVCATLMQTLGLGAYIVWREPKQLLHIIRAWRVAGWVGLAGMLASAGWFTAMTIQNAAYVKGLAQIELVFTFITSVILFKERIAVTEIGAILLIVIGVLLLVV